MSQAASSIGSAVPPRSIGGRWARPGGIVLIGTAVGLFVAFLWYGVFVLHYGPADALTYLAAGERLNVGHPLYALSPGDRPVDLRPPYWTVPLLSPPTIGVVWRPLAALPNEWGVVLWTMVCATAIIGVLLAIFRVRPVFASAVLLVFLVPLVYEIPTGNVNGLLLLGVVGVWLLVRDGRDRPAGAILSLLVALKLTPIVLAGWLLTQRKGRALLAFACGGIVIAGVTVLGAGFDSTFAYLSVIADTQSGGSTQFSLAGLLRDVGIPPGVARFAPILADIVGFGLMWRFRSRTDVTYSIGVFTMVWGSPVMNVDWLTLMIAALAPGIWPPKVPGTSVPGHDSLVAVRPST